MWQTQGDIGSNKYGYTEDIILFQEVICIFFPFLFFILVSYIHSASGPICQHYDFFFIFIFLSKHGFDVI